MSAHRIENALKKAVENKKDFDQFAGAIDNLSKKFIKDEEERSEFLEKLADKLFEFNS